MVPFKVQTFTNSKLLGLKIQMIFFGNNFLLTKPVDGSEI